MSEAENSILTNIKIFNPVHDFVLIENFITFFVGKKYLDMIFICKGNIQVPAHKTVLASVSEYLGEIIRSNSQDVLFITVPDVDAETLQIVVNFIYEGITKVTASELLSVKNTINLLGIRLQDTEVINADCILNNNLNNMCGVAKTSLRHESAEEFTKLSKRKKSERTDNESNSNGTSFSGSENYSHTHVYEEDIPVIKIEKDQENVDMDVQDVAEHTNDNTCATSASDVNHTSEGNDSTFKESSFRESENYSQKPTKCISVNTEDNKYHENVDINMQIVSKYSDSDNNLCAARTNEDNTSQENNCTLNCEADTANIPLDSAIDFFCNFSTPEDMISINDPSPVDAINILRGTNINDESCVLRTADESSLSNGNEATTRIPETKLSTENEKENNLSFSFTRTSKVLSEEQVSTLEEMFKKDMYPSYEVRTRLCEEWKINLNYLTRWFSKKRARMRKHAEKSIAAYSHSSPLLIGTSKILTKKQVILLDDLFKKDMYLSYVMRDNLSKQWGVSPKYLSLWFANRRKRMRKCAEKTEHLKSFLSSLKNHPVIGKEQKHVLITSFKENKFPTPEKKAKLAKELCISEKTVFNWFRNRRALERRSAALRSREMGVDMPSSAVKDESTGTLTINSLTEQASVDTKNINILENNEMNTDYENDDDRLIICENDDDNVDNLKEGTVSTQHENAMKALDDVLATDMKMDSEFTDRTELKEENIPSSGLTLLAGVAMNLSSQQTGITNGSMLNTTDKGNVSPFPQETSQNISVTSVNNICTAKIKVKAVHSINAEVIGTNFDTAGFSDSTYPANVESFSSVYSPTNTDHNYVAQNENLISTEIFSKTKKLVSPEEKNNKCSVVCDSRMESDLTKSIGGNASVFSSDVDDKDASSKTDVAELQIEKPLIKYVFKVANSTRDKPECFNPSKAFQPRKDTAKICKILPNFLCTKCKMIYTTTQQLAEHCLSVHGIKLNACEKCNKIFSTAENHSVHLQEHHKYCKSSLQHNSNK